MATDDTSPTLTEQDRIANLVSAALAQAAALIPNLEAPHPATSKSLRAARLVTRESLAQLIAIVEEVEVMRRMETFDVADARETLQFIDAFRPVADQIAALLAALNHTMEARKARVVAAGLRTYAVAKGLARDDRGAEVHAALEHLRTRMRRARSRKRDTSP